MTQPAAQALAGGGVGPAEVLQEPPVVHHAEEAMTCAVPAGHAAPFSHLDRPNHPDARCGARPRWVTLLAMSIRATTCESGLYGLFRWDMGPRSGGPRPHHHKTFSEAFCVLDGTVQLGDGNEWVDARAGDFLYVPQSGIHAFRNDNDACASMLILFAPGALRDANSREGSGWSSTRATTSTWSNR
jgi:mannose-6-phosphate isomerase-like protein (cupin superfamily)